VLARVNGGTDLERLIEDEGVGKVYVGDSVDELKRLAEDLADNDVLRHSMSERGRQLGRRMFSPETAARQIVALPADRSPALGDRSGTSSQPENTRSE
jgi:glycosyltransferase involved in cell wall biosynthesis